MSSAPDLLTAPEVLALHAAVASTLGATPGPCDVASLEAALADVEAYATGDALDLFECTDLFEVAARLLLAFTEHAPFATHGRATALAATVALIHVNGMALDAPPDALVDALDAAATGRSDVVEVAWRLRGFARPW